MKMEPTVSSEMSAIRTQTPGNYPKRNKLHKNILSVLLLLLLVLLCAYHGFLLFIIYLYQQMHIRVHVRTFFGTNK